MGPHVLAGGAGGLVAANLYTWQTVFESGSVLPAVQIDAGKADQLRTWLASGAGHVGSITGFSFVSDPAAADVLAWFSSRGPNPVVIDVLKPDLIAPGVDILAATKDPASRRRSAAPRCRAPTRRARRRCSRAAPDLDAGRGPVGAHDDGARPTASSGKMA